MAIRITRLSKRSLIVETPVMNSAGTLGYGDQYHDLIDLAALGAFVTNPLTYTTWSPATGTRVVPVDSGVLVHTGLPNPGLSKVIEENRAVWERIPVPVIAHVVVNKADEVRQSVAMLEREDSIDAIELGMSDDISAAEIEWYMRSVSGRAEKPLLVRLPFGATLDQAKAAIDGGADALVAFAPPRGTARDRSGRLVAGRIYGPLMHPLILRMVGQLARRITAVPLIASGGIHSPQQARDYIEAGASAVQVGSATWTMPRLIETIARDLGGMQLTQPTDPMEDFFSDES